MMLQSSSKSYCYIKDYIEMEMATHSSILAWESPWTEGPDGLESVGSQRIRHNWVTKHVAHTLWSMTNSCPTGILGWSRLAWAPRMRELTWQGVQGPSRKRWTFSLSLSLAHQCIMPKNWPFFRSGTNDYTSTMSYSRKCFS